MEISLFDVIGPVMIGPSSSHTAGAVRLGGVARALCTRSVDRVVFDLHGSFAKTYQGHGTDLALLGGVLGMEPDDERIRQAFAIAQEGGLKYEFREVMLEGVHENTVNIRFFDGDEVVQELVGSSVGGGRIFIHTLNGSLVSITGEAPALVIRHRDTKGILSGITSILSGAEVNLGTLHLTRTAKGGYALCIMELDEPVPEAVVNQIQALADVVSVQRIQMKQEEKAYVQ